jgi:hypothetical protein
LLNLSQSKIDTRRPMNDGIQLRLICSKWQVGN